MARDKWNEYDYKAQAAPNMGWAYRPMIDIEVSLPGSPEKIPLLALIDSGTDGTVMHAEIAENLGVDWEHAEKRTLGGIGSLEGFVTTVEIHVPDFGLRYDTAAFFGKPVPMDALLGQGTFFPHFKIRFEKKINKFYMAVA